jgi:DNA-binding transcriptional LysR family regulator
MLSFVTIATLGSLKAASHRLHLTESALSHSLKNLEEDLGIKLFERDSKRLVLSEAGHIALEDARQILDNMQFMRNRMKCESATKKQSLRIIVGSSFLRFYCPQIIASLQDSFSGCKIQILLGDRNLCMNALEKDDADFAVTIDPPEDSNKYNVVPLFKDKLSLIVGHQHPLAEYQTISPRQISNEFIFLSNTDSYTCKQILRSMENFRLPLRHISETRSNDSIIQIVSMGLGCSFQSNWACQDELASGRIKSIDVDDLKIDRTWSITFPANRILSRLGESFIENCQKAVIANPRGTILVKDTNSLVSS